MKILHVIANIAPRYGGPPRACRDTARAVARRGHDVSILTTNQDGPVELGVPTDRAIEEDGVRLRYFPIQAPRFWGTSWPLAKALETEIPAHDVVHIHSLYLFHDWIAGRICRRVDTPYVVQPHGTLDPYLHRRHRLRKSVMEAAFQNRELRNAATILYTTEEEMALAAPFARGAPGAVVPIGLDKAEFDDMPAPGGFRAGHPEIGDKAIVLFFGRLNFKKGLDILARAFAAIARERDDIHLVLAGPDDGMRTKAERWLADEGVAEHATFTGMLLGDEKLALLCDSDLFVLPSYSENFGIAVVEAMACGLPVLISDKVNIWREVVAAKAGAVAPPEADAFGREMAAILDDPILRGELSTNARAFARTRFDWAVIAEQLEAMYAAAASRTA